MSDTDIANGSNCSGETSDKLEEGDDCKREEAELGIQNRSRSPWSRLGFQDKTLWDWLKLAIVPLTLTVVGLVFSCQQNSRQLEIESDRFQEQAMQSYYDDMAMLLLDQQMDASGSNLQANSLARARTLSVLRRLDPERKATLLLFLYESELINVTDTVINIEGADLTGN